MKCACTVFSLLQSPRHIVAVSAGVHVHTAAWKKRVCASGTWWERGWHCASKERILCASQIPRRDRLRPPKQSRSLPHQLRTCGGSSRSSGSIPTVSVGIPDLSRSGPAKLTLVTLRQLDPLAPACGLPCREVVELPGHRPCPPSIEPGNFTLPWAAKRRRGQP